MASNSETTPFLADDDHDDSYGGEESHPIKTSEANSYFKRPIRILTSLIAFFCLSVFGLLIASYVMVEVGPFVYTYSSEESIRSLAICLFINFILSTPTIFLQIPIIINIAIHIAISIVIFVFSGRLFSDGWPNSNFCRRWENTPGNYRPLPDTPECIEARTTVRIMIGVSAGMGIIIGLFILAVLLLRLVAVSRTRFWEKQKLAIPWYNPTGFTVQFTLTVLPHSPEDKKSKSVATSSGGEQERLIET
ncbi:hypothetical protein F5884DRAFT_862117 [Xylogone sp. PMI_703]|nr:hypothetical protein F5884DRAFT_862117 [Xylogone sp. PMI_703]